MTTTCTFDSTTVQTRQITRIEQLGTTIIYKFECTVSCRTTTYANYTALAAKAGIVGKTTLYSGKTSVQTIGGTLGTLVLNGITYTNCYIESIGVAEVSQSCLGMWDFTISFVKDTSL